MSRFLTPDGRKLPLNYNMFNIFKKDINFYFIQCSFHNSGGIEDWKQHKFLPHLYALELYLPSDSTVNTVI